MSRYINKDELIEKIEKVIAFYKHYINNCNFEDDFIHSIEGMDEADVEEVRHGKWIVVEDKNGNEVKLCSHCAREGCYESTYEESFDYDYNENCYCDGYEEHREYISTRYCPWCGTKMDL